MPPVLFPIKYAKTSNNFSAMPLCAMMIPPKINSGIASNGVLFNPPTTFLKTKGIEAENPGEIRLGINDTTSSITPMGTVRISMTTIAPKLFLTFYSPSFSVVFSHTLTVLAECFPPSAEKSVRIRPELPHRHNSWKG